MPSDPRVPTGDPVDAPLPPGVTDLLVGRSGDWTVSARRGSAAVLHDLSAASVSVPLHGRQVVVNEVDAPAWVLGSTQSPEVLRSEVRAGAAVVRRRSGGGLVPLSPGAQLWVDLVLPVEDPLWDADASRLARRAGRWWRAALVRAAADPVRVRADDGAPGRSDVPGDLGRVVCFAGLGAGEVEVAGPAGTWLKAVGISQRRTRHGAVLQCVVPRRFDHAALLDALAPDVVGADVVAALRAVLAEHATTGLGALVDGLLVALVDELTHH